MNSTAMQATWSMGARAVYLSCESEEYLGGYGQSSGWRRIEIAPEESSWPYVVHTAAPKSGKRARKAALGTNYSEIKSGNCFKRGSDLLA